LLLSFWAEKKVNLIVMMCSVGLTFSLLNISITNIEIHRIPEKMVFFSILAKLILLIILLINLHLAFAKGTGRVNSRHLHLLPASATEKFVYLILTGFVIPITIYISLFELLNFVFVQLKLSSSFSFQQFLFSEITLFEKQVGVETISVAIKLFILLIYYLKFHMLVWGLIIFKEYALLKVFAIVYFSLQIIPFIAFQVFNQNYVFNYISSLQQYATDSQAGITLFSWILFIVFFSIISMLFYVNYLQFKRKEIKL
ncbi:MAG: hypothetical protein Q8T08_15675, partial [Ignavibacteria bacterium]|nr:hypothetical protein [Ignavibacteria bacterium]